MTLVIRCLLVAAVVLFTHHPAAAQDLSSRPIRIIVGLVAGGATDVTARLVAQKLTERLRTNVYVDNRPGGLFIPATKELAGAEPDGHTGSGFGAQGGSYRSPAKAVPIPTKA